MYNERDGYIQNHSWYFIDGYVNDKLANTGFAATNHNKWRNTD